MPTQGAGTLDLGDRASVQLWADNARCNMMRLSALVGMLPFMEQQALWEQISNPLWYVSGDWDQFRHWAVAAIIRPG